MHKSPCSDTPTGGDSSEPKPAKRANLDLPPSHPPAAAAAAAGYVTSIAPQGSLEAELTAATSELAAAQGKLALAESERDKALKDWENASVAYKPVYQVSLLSAQEDYRAAQDACKAPRELVDSFKRAL